MMTMTMMMISGWQWTRSTPMMTLQQLSAVQMCAASVLCCWLRQHAELDEVMPQSLFLVVQSDGERTIIVMLTHPITSILGRTWTNILSAGKHPLSRVLAIVRSVKRGLSCLPSA
jgi:hypothetical protein